MARIVSAARGAAEVRLRLYLWLWAVGAVRPETVPVHRHTSGEWAVLLNLLPSPNNQRLREQAARRVSGALRWLADEALVERVGRDGVRLLDPDGSGAEYRPWTPEEVTERDRTRAYLTGVVGLRARETSVWEDTPVEIPLAWWVNGTVSALSARALAVLLVCFDHQRAGTGLFDVPKVRRSQHCLGPDSWKRGIAELEALACLRRIPDSERPLFGSNSGQGRAAVYRNLWSLDRRRLFGLQRERVPRPLA